MKFAYFYALSLLAFLSAPSVLASQSCVVSGTYRHGNNIAESYQLATFTMPTVGASYELHTPGSGVLLLTRVSSTRISMSLRFSVFGLTAQASSSSKSSGLLDGFHLSANALSGVMDVEITQTFTCGPDSSLPVK